MTTDPVSNEKSPATCRYDITLDPCKDEYMQNIKPKTPFPFPNQLYRIFEPDMIIAEWTGWGDMADSFFGGSQCKKGYGIEFYVSRDGGATH